MCGCRRACQCIRCWETLLHACWCWKMSRYPHLVMFVSNLNKICLKGWHTCSPGVLNINEPLRIHDGIEFLAWLRSCIVCICFTSRKWMVSCFFTSCLSSFSHSQLFFSSASNFAKRSITSYPCLVAKNHGGFRCVVISFSVLMWAFDVSVVNVGFSRSMAGVNGLCV